MTTHSPNRYALAFVFGSWLAAAPVDSNAQAAEIAPGLHESISVGGSVEVIIEFAAASERPSPPPGASFESKVTSAVTGLQSAAAGAQADVLKVLLERGMEHRPFWIANAIWARVDRATLAQLAVMAEVRRIDANPVLQQRLPPALPAASRVPNAIEWGVQRVGAPALWARGIRGQGVVIAGQDTGYQWDHPALRSAYRGWNGSVADHNYHWHDAIHALIGGGSNVCGVNSSAPCDDNNHGSHTMGSMVGDDGAANQIGVAPAARWIGCRNMERGNGTPATYLECLQWFLAPTDLAGNNPDPSRAPHVINNSWGCPPEEGCTSVGVLEDAVDNLRAAGILVVVSAGNSGSACGSINTAPGPYPSSFTVGATDSNDLIASFSSRGPATVDDVTFLLKPDISGPGVAIRSSVRGGNYGNSNGTSMAGPHVAGAAALLMSADPRLRGNPEAVETLLRASARPQLSAQSCGGFLGSLVPNAVFGHGIVHAERAVALIGPLFSDGFETD
ncbi:MAG: S8 family serine peptidase [Pseudomarimonas sp.]